MNLATRILCVSIAAGVALSTAASAQVISPQAITATGSFSNSLNLLADGVVPLENTFWTAPENVFWTGFDTVITLDYGSSHHITDVLVSVDNNDIYQFDYSLDGITYNPLFTILISDGNVAETPGGMDTMSTDSNSPEFISGLDFAPVNARFLRVQALVGGDALNAIGEISVISVQTVGAVPEPSTYGLLGAAMLIGLVALRRGRGLKN